MTDPTHAYEISGRPGAAETAAILAVIAHLTEEEAAAMAAPPARPRQSAWVLAWRPRPATPALPSHSFDAMPWSEVEGSEDAS